MEEKYQKYIDLLNKWQSKINLVSSTTLSEAYKRHIKDSIELGNYIKDKTVKIYDLGAGGGFPGLPLAIEGYSNINLVESDVRKCAFMQQVKIAYSLKSTNILNKRVERIDDIADVITCRAFSSLLNIFDLSSGMRSKDTEYILLKGENIKQEIKEAETKYLFDYDIVDSSVYSSVKIVIIKNVRLHV
ncbi:MAG: 16S rRNA (guanine(527)-N(7))-methyltransferase RsmG [Alphaproteobacteria bacterium]|jgi:16S rRNA (guanine527-N7)-methyltransferase|nr:16S rRNA (guanine(527)-N(7))-methyltransferase RsmG [Alphaproteobacteria bacterium]